MQNKCSLSWFQGCQAQEMANHAAKCLAFEQQHYHMETALPSFDWGGTTSQIMYDMRTCAMIKQLEIACAPKNSLHVGCLDDACVLSACVGWELLIQHSGPQENWWASIWVPKLQSKSLSPSWPHSAPREARTCLTASGPERSAASQTTRLVFRGVLGMLARRAQTIGMVLWAGTFEPNQIMLTGPECWTLLI